MNRERELLLRRLLEEPLGGESRDYPLDEDALLVTTTDMPFFPPFVPDVMHVHNCLEIGVCLSGSGVIRLGNEAPRTFSPGDLVFVPRGLPHSQQNAEEPVTQFIYVVLNEDYLLHRTPKRFQPEFAALMALAARGGLFLEGGAHGGVGEMIRVLRQLPGGDDERAAMRQELCAMTLLSLIARQAAALPLPQLPGGAPEPRPFGTRSPLEPALAYVCAHYAEIIKVGELARSCSMSESYFRRVFTKSMGLSPLDYTNRYRVHRSMYLLRMTSEPVQNIAARVGFASIAAFNRNFRRYAGVSPSQWRRKRNPQNDGALSWHSEQ